MPEDAWIQTAATCMNTAMRMRQRVGPYLLFGSCIGGIIAWEMARHLEASGEIVHLFLVDTTHPRARSNGKTRLPAENQMQRSGRKVTNPRAERTLAYRPEPLMGRVRLLANADWHRDHPALGWDEVAIDPRDITVVPKEHQLRLSFSEVAAWLRAGLTEVDLQPLSSAHWNLF
jgi:thioesterase domain-containing protein